LVVVSVVPRFYRATRDHDAMGTVWRPRSGRFRAELLEAGLTVAVTAVAPALRLTTLLSITPLATVATWPALVCLLCFPSQVTYSIQST